MGLLLAPLAGAVVVVMADTRSWARGICGLSFARTPIDRWAAVDLVVANTRVAAIPLLAALTLGSGARRTARDAADLLVTLVVVLNVLPLGLALGGYGPARLLPWIPHWPLEAAALAVALDTYLQARTGHVDVRVLLRVAGWVLALLVAGALVETFATPHA